MKRILATALILGAVSGFGLVGCGETTSTSVEETTKGPGGTTTRTIESSEKKTGENPPLPGAPDTATTTTTK
jgi:hypothetical protein